MFKKSVQPLWPPPVSIPTEYVRFRKVWLWFILANAGTWFTNMNMLFQLGKNMNKGRKNTKTTQKASEKNTWIISIRVLNMYSENPVPVHRVPTCFCSTHWDKLISGTPWCYIFCPQTTENWVCKNESWAPNFMALLNGKIHEKYDKSWWNYVELIKLLEFAQHFKGTNPTNHILGNLQPALRGK